MSRQDVPLKNQDANNESEKKSRATRKRNKKEKKQRQQQSQSQTNIRNKFLHKLGIPKPSPANSTAGDAQKPREVLLLRNALPIQERLKAQGDDRNQDINSERTPAPAATSASWASSLTTTTSRVSRRTSDELSISFNDNVSVVPIPMRNEYSDRVRGRLWTNVEEIHENAQRNLIEFAAEGYNWRDAKEDDEMYVCSATGDLVHPVHCEYPHLDYPFSFD
eukprot:CAMPEP_0172485778 /NCGR_PEP_ID=MMETSP1066-20121228/13965_1 /TAXON_ID=671091 /ORGANISM="Coscinodiscus wailesii, Strain CCMP2513" /LENGTH=220 /DNA_ID=CAMNT_0013251243 /DNA_START=28 /DNA_END=690 /DNA_ORIENTATION=-